MSIPREIQNRVSGTPNIIEDYTTLAGLTASTDAIWLSSAYAIQEAIDDGTLVEFLRIEQPVEVTHYALKRRSQSPLARTIFEAFR